MRGWIALALCIASGCAQPVDPEVKLIDDIEAHFVMPDGVKSLDGYARYNARNRDGSISAVLTDAFVDYDPRDDCYNLENGTVKCEPPSYPILKPGERIWIERSENLPSFAEGGCGVIELEIPKDRLRGLDQPWKLKLKCNERA